MCFPKSKSGKAVFKITNDDPRHRILVARVGLLYTLAVGLRRTAGTASEEIRLEFVFVSVFLAFLVDVVREQHICFKKAAEACEFVG